MAVRILVVDDHPIVRHGLKALLGEMPEWQVIAEAADGVDAVAKARLNHPDVVLLDISMPRMNGLEACRIIRDTVPGCEVIIVSQHDSAEVLNKSLDAGARGYVVKSQAGRDLLTAVTAVSQHKPFTPLVPLSNY
jgi:DNA-binding NarL/FixJ family response regulator